jgi:hemoglobin-like flavoprotein
MHDRQQQESFDDLFAASYGRVMKDGAYNPQFIGRFYERFLASSADVAARFAGTDMSRQKTMLHDSLQSLIDFNQRRTLSPAMSRLARVHSRAGQDIPPRLYEDWMASLLATVAEFDPQYSDAVELAWRLTLAPGIVYLAFGYDHALP